MSETAVTEVPSFAGYPRGWFVIGFSEELAPGQVKPIRYFGQDLVLFRGETGGVKVLDAYCPHMGAHLGHPGKVVGDAIVCPFHAWKFDGAGRCIEVPYATRIPPMARVPCWSVREKNGMIYLWNDRDRRGPDWEIPDLPQTADARWTPGTASWST